jgi:hypothetical protein
MCAHHVQFSTVPIFVPPAETSHSDGYNFVYALTEESPSVAWRRELLAVISSLSFFERKNIPGVGFLGHHRGTERGKDFFFFNVHI